jgi:hypothetical protein
MLRWPRSRGIFDPNRKANKPNRLPSWVGTTRCAVRSALRWASLGLKVAVFAGIATEGRRTYVFSANGAFSFSAWGNAPGFATTSDP